MSSNIGGGPRRVKPKGARPPIRRGEMYTSQQLCWRMDIGEATLRIYRNEGLQPAIGSKTHNETQGLMWDADDIINFLKARRSKG